MRSRLSLIAALLFATSGAASAEGVGETIGSWFAEAQQDLLLLGCLPSERPLRVAVHGIPAADPHFDAYVRERLNDAVVQGLGAAAGPLVSVDVVEGLGALAPTLRGSDGSAAMAEALAAVSEAHLPVVVTVGRPAPDVARLRLTMFARSSEGGYACPRPLALDVEVPSITLAAPVATPRRHLTLDGAVREGVAAVADDLAGRERIAIAVEGPDCPLVEEVADGFLGAYARHGRRADLPGPALPPVDRLAAGAAPADGITISVEPRDGAAGTADLVLRRLAGGVEAERMSATVVVEPASVQACIPAPACEAEADISRFQLDPPEARVGDRLTIRVELSGCLPTFFAIGGTKVTPFPRELFDVTVAADGSKSYLISPTTRRSIAVGASEPTGRNTIAVVCACNAEPGPEQLAGWLRELAPLLGPSASAGRLSDGVPFAFASFEKLD